MAFKPWCGKCKTWHTEKEGHRDPELDDITIAMQREEIERLRAENDALRSQLKMRP